MTAITAPTTPITIATGATQIYSQLLLLHQQLPQNTYITTAAAATTTINAVSYTHLRAHETILNLV